MPAIGDAEVPAIGDAVLEAMVAAEPGAAIAKCEPVQPKMPAEEKKKRKFSAKDAEDALTTRHSALGLMKALFHGLQPLFDFSFKDYVPKALLRPPSLNEKIYRDPHTGKYFYYDTETLTSTWTLPLLPAQPVLVLVQDECSVGH